MPPPPNNKISIHICVLEVLAYNFLNDTTLIRNAIKIMNYGQLKPVSLLIHFASIERSDVPNSICIGVARCFCFVTA